MRKPEILIKPQAQYLTEIIKQTSEVSKTTLVLVENHFSDAIRHEWKRIKKDLIPLNMFIDTNPEMVSKEGPTQMIEKLTILDLMYDRQLTNYFIKLRRFPYMLKGEEI